MKFVHVCRERETLVCPECLFEEGRRVGLQEANWFVRFILGNSKQAKIISKQILELYDVKKKSKLRFSSVKKRLDTK